MILDRKHFSFLVQVIDRSHLKVANGYEEGRVLDILEFLGKGELSANQMAAAYMKRVRIRDIYIIYIDDGYGFLLLPQLVEV